MQTCSPAPRRYATPACSWRATACRSTSDWRAGGAVATALDRLAAQIRACRICVDHPVGVPLAHAPRPVLRVSRTARIAVVGQAPGTRVHASGIPFSDASGERLRAWMGVTADEF